MSWWNPGNTMIWITSWMPVLGFPTLSRSIKSFTTLTVQLHLSGNPGWISSLMYLMGKLIEPRLVIDICKLILYSMNDKMPKVIAFLKNLPMVRFPAAREAETMSQYSTTCDYGVSYSMIVMNSTGTKLP